MKPAIPYLIFPGICRDALAFYKETLGAELVQVQTFQDSPFVFPEGTEQWIFNAELRVGQLELRASDCHPDQDYSPGNHVALFISFDREDLAEIYFHALARGGFVIMPFNGVFGMVCDPFGFQWMISLDQQESKQETILQGSSYDT